MALAAKIEVLDCASLTIDDRKIVKGRPVTISDLHEIKKWEATSGVKVTRIGEEAIKQKVESLKEPDEKKSEEDETEDEVEEVYTYSELKRFTKEELVALGKSLEPKVFFQGSELKDFMIEEIMKSQGESE
jgi:hypothetical protein